MTLEEVSRWLKVAENKEFVDVITNHLINLRVESSAVAFNEAVLSVQVCKSLA